MPNDKKRKRDHHNQQQQQQHHHHRGTSAATQAASDEGMSAPAADIDTSKPTALFSPTPGGRRHTFSVALPGTIVANAKSHDLKTSLCGTIARALAVFCVDEVVIFDDSPRSALSPPAAVDPEAYTAFDNPCHFLAHLLAYLETPPHLRKSLFAMHPNLRTAGTLPSLDMPHHLRATEWCEFREGVTTSVSASASAPDAGASGTLVDTGLRQPSHVADSIPPNTRVTLRLGASASAGEPACVVAPSTPRESGGYYWGYTVRQCGPLSTVFTESPFPDGYDMVIGTSERGAPLSAVVPSLSSNSSSSSSDSAGAGAGAHPPRHLLLVLGGVAGLETAARNDPELAARDVGAGNVRDLFDHWVNVLPGQGSRTIRTEEALWLGLMGLRPVVEAMAA